MRLRFARQKFIRENLLLNFNTNLSFLQILRPYNFNSLLIPSLFILFQFQESMFPEVYYECPMQEDSPCQPKSKFQIFLNFPGENELNLDSDFNFISEQEQYVFHLHEGTVYQQPTIQLPSVMKKQVHCPQTKIELDQNLDNLASSLIKEEEQMDEEAAASSTIEEQPPNDEQSQDIDDFENDSNSRVFAQTPKTKGIKKPKLKKNGEPRKDDKSKNVPYNVVQHVIRHMINTVGEDRIQKLLKKYSATNEKILSLLRSQNNANVGLGKLYDILNYHAGEESLRPARRVLHQYFTWYLRNRYQIHILLSTKIEDREMYIKDKNQLIYILTLTKEGKEKIRLNELKKRNATHFAQI